MKIFNVQPITVNEYIFNKEYISKSKFSSNYQSDFDYDFDPVSPNTFTIIFDLQYTVGDDFDDIILPSSKQNEFFVQVDGGGQSSEILLSYNYSCQFDFENEGFDIDVLSLNDFLEEFYMHIKRILEQPEFEFAKEKEEKIRKFQPLRETVFEIIDNLRANNMYSF
jgi:hypothetical protein